MLALQGTGKKKKKEKETTRDYCVLLCEHLVQDADYHSYQQGSSMSYGSFVIIVQSDPCVLLF